MMAKISAWFHSQTIRNKVLAFGLVMSTIPLLFISYYYYSNVKNDLGERIIDKQNLVLQNLSNEIELEFNQIIQSIQVFSVLSQIHAEKKSFYELLQQNHSIEEIVVTNEQGLVEKRVSRYQLNLPENHERWFADEMWIHFQKEDKVFGEVEFNQFGQPVMKIAIPFHENGIRKGIGVVVQLQKIIGQISSLKQDESSDLFLMDRNGRVIAHQDYSKLWQKQKNVNHKDVLGVKAKIDDLKWTIVMEQPEAMAYQPINELFRNGLTVFAILTLIVSLISIYAGLYFTNPIIKLDKAIKKIQFGSKVESVQIKRNDEMGQLVKSFNKMGKELQEKSIRLAQEKERLDIVVNGIGAGLALVTKGYRLTWMNPTIKKWLDDEEVSLPCYVLIGGRETPCENCPITCDDIVENIDKVMTFKGVGGEEKIFRHRVYPLNHSIEDEGDFLIVIEDITEQKHMEEKIIQTDKLSALGLMASSFAHEVNNPLAAIHVYAEDLIDRIIGHDESLDEKELEFYLRKIKDNTVRCKKITGNLLNFSRKANWSTSHVDLKETIQNSISLVEYSLKKHQILIDVNIEEHLPEIFGDSLKLMQVLVNLINNSVDAMEDGGTISISAATQGEKLLLTVIDTGSGVAKENLPKIFDPFYTTKPVGKGTGLGLSVCYGIIQQFGGTIQIKSELGIGTTVEIQIPFISRLKEGSA